jgi:hypothetical protein
MSEHTGDAELQFDTVTPPALPDAVPAPDGVVCVVCRQAIPHEYFDVNGQALCGACRTRVMEDTQTPTGWGVLVRAGVFGLVAAMAGAILYSP